LRQHFTVVEGNQVYVGADLQTQPTERGQRTHGYQVVRRKQCGETIGNGQRAFDSLCAGCRAEIGERNESGSRTKPCRASAAANAA
jgi:hypothetical protein